MQKIVYLEKQDPNNQPTEILSEEDRIDVAVNWINAKVAHTMHFGLLQVGFYLLTNFFDGSLENALSKSPKKAQSFRKLCRRGDLSISATHLVNAVKLVVQEKTLAGDRTFTSLPVSHKIALLPVEDLDLKRALAERTADEGLSVRALTREVRGARKRGLPQQAWSRRLRRALETVKKEAEAPEASELRELGQREAEALKASVQQAKERLERVLDGLPSQASAAPEATAEEPPKAEVTTAAPPTPEDVSVVDAGAEDNSADAEALQEPEAKTA